MSEQHIELFGGPNQAAIEALQRELLAGEGRMSSEEADAIQARIKKLSDESLGPQGSPVTYRVG